MIVFLLLDIFAFLEQHKDSVHVTHCVYMASDNKILHYAVS